MAAVEREMPAWQWTSRWLSLSPALVELLAELDQRLDMLALGRLPAGPWADDVVKAQGEPMVRVVGREASGSGIVRIEDREHVRDLARAVAVELVDAADGQAQVRLEQVVSMSVLQPALRTGVGHGRKG